MGVTKMVNNIRQKLQNRKDYTESLEYSPVIGAVIFRSPLVR